jgi:hypothetical protein
MRVVAIAVVHARVVLSSPHASAYEKFFGIEGHGRRATDPNFFMPVTRRQCAAIFGFPRPALTREPDRKSASPREGKSVALPAKGKRVSGSHPQGRTPRTGRSARRAGHSAGCALFGTSARRRLRKPPETRVRLKTGAAGAAPRPHRPKPNRTLPLGGRRRQLSRIIVGRCQGLFSIIGRGAGEAPDVIPAKAGIQRIMPLPLDSGSRSARPE